MMNTSLLRKRFLRPLVCLPAAALLLLSAGLATADEHKSDKPLIHSEALLWKVEKEGSPNNHLLGTFHIPNREIVVKVPKPIIEALKGSKIAAFEIINKNRITFRKGQNPAFLRDGRTLLQIIGPELFEKLIATTQKDWQMPRRYYYALKPWAVAPTGGFTPQQKALVAAGRPVLDDHLMDRAWDFGLKLEPLEISGERIYGFDLLSDEDHIKLIEHGLATYKDKDKRMAEYIELYLNRDVDAIVKKSRATWDAMGPAASQLLWEEFLLRRNERMLDRALPLMKDGNVFIAVGVAHLPGRGGMADLLVKKGFKLTKVY